MNLNIIIPTHNRPNRLQRILGYYNECKHDFQIIVADSSSDEKKKENKEIITNFSNPKILYLNNYPSTIEISNKLADAVNHADKKYCVFCADDDFVTISGIEKAISFLEENLDFSCARGDYIGFYVRNNEGGEKQFCWKKSHACQSITSSIPEERLILNFSKYIATFYAVHRTDFLTMLFQETMKYADDDRFGELLPSMLDVIHGKMKNIGVFYGAREILINSGGGTSKRIQYFIGEGTFKNKYARFKECLSTHLADVSNISKKDAGKIVDQGWNEYAKKYKGYKIPKINYIMKKMSLPPFVDENLRRIYRKVSNRKKQTYMSDFVSSHDSQVEKDEDFKSIKKYVLFHSKNEL